MIPESDGYVFHKLLATRKHTDTNKSVKTIDVKTDKLI